MWIRAGRGRRHHTSFSRVIRWSYNSNVYLMTDIVLAYDTNLHWGNHVLETQLERSLESRHVPHWLITLTLHIIGHLGSAEDRWSIRIKWNITGWRSGHALMPEDGCGWINTTGLTHLHYLLWQGTADWLGNEHLKEVDDSVIPALPGISK